MKSDEISAEESRPKCLPKKRFHYYAMRDNDHWVIFRDGKHLCERPTAQAAMKLVDALNKQAKETNEEEKTKPNS